MRELTPLDRLSGLDAPLRKKLADYWITSVEEFVSTARASNQQYGSGRAALAVALGVGDDRLKALIEAALPLLPPDVSFSVPVELDVGAGLFVDDYRDVDGASFGPPVALPDKVEPLASLPRAVFQGVRNSCVAFTLAAIYQILSKDNTDLSEQFLYWACKSRDNIRGDVGTNPLVAMTVLQQVGICTEAAWPYQPAPSDSANPGHGPAPERAVEEAKLRRIKRFQQLPAKDFRQIKAALAAGKPVLIGLPIWEHWQGAWQGRTMGRIRAPLPGERQRGGHAMCALGYRDDPSAPGGGYFIVRNSWGPEWAKDNPDGPGYCHVPYRVIFEQGLAAIAAEGVESAPAPPLTGGAPAAVPGARPMGGSASAAGAGAETASGPSQEALRSILEDARRLGEQLSALIKKLEPLVQDVAPAPALAVAAAEPGAASKVGVARKGSAVSGPLRLVAGAADPGRLLTPLGLSPRGEPLLEIDARVAAELAKGKLSQETKEQISLYKAKRQSQVAHLGVVADIKAAELDQARWAVVINGYEDSALIKAIWPLIEHRMRQMKLTPPPVNFKDGESAAEWLSRHTDGATQNLKDHWGKIPPVMIYRPGERAGQWLGRHGVASGPVDPRRGVPYYLMIVGRPGALSEGDNKFIPMNFQYLLDIFWGVGRLCFTDSTGNHRPEDYAAYVERLVNFELAQDARERLRKEVVYFGTKHDADIATIRSANELALPLTRWHEDPANTPGKLGFAMRSFLEGEATRDNLGKILNLGGGDKPPAVLFTAGHGLGLPLSDPDLVMHQGALITQDWTGGPVRREHWLAGDDLGSAKVDGMFAFLFACYGLGCPDLDEFVFTSGAGVEEERPQVAEFPLIAQLPQRLLVNGALGVLGHVDRAWTFSFSGVEAKVTAQSQPFEDVLGRLLKGKRAGDATDQFNTIQGDRAMTLTEELENIKFGKQVDDFELARLWMARNDARNYALLGDPAARLPFDSAE
jgi:hypothetical protein